MSERPPLLGLLLTGGRSRRMGSDKALLARDGDRQLDRGMALLAGQVGNAYVSVRADQVDEAARARYAQIVDRYDDLGPIAGVLSAMDAEPRAAWLVLACDLPNVTADTLRRLLDGRDSERPFTAYRSVHNDLPEPLCAIFEPGARALIDAFIADGIRCPRKMMIQAGACLLEQADATALDNVNTPGDLAKSRLQVAS